MNDYPDHTQLAIDAMMRAGDPGQTAEWAERARAIGRRLAVAADELRTMIRAVSAAWSDGPGSDRMIADLTGIADHLQLLADLVAGQPASWAGLISEAASALAAVQAASESALGADSGPGAGGDRGLAADGVSGLGAGGVRGLGAGGDSGLGTGPGTGPGRKPGASGDRGLGAGGPGRAGQRARARRGRAARRAGQRAG